MPERDLEVTVGRVILEWGSLRMTGAGQLRLTSDALVIEAAAHDPWQARYADLRGGGWRAGAIIVHGEPGRVILEAPHGLDQAWPFLVARACPLPELARVHRLLGSRRGGAVDQQARFLAPLLQARKRLEDVADLDTRVAALDARALRERLDAVIAGIAQDAYPASHPDRRALEAELEEAMAPLFGSLDSIHSAARDFRNAPEAVRFVAWRDWVAAVARVFALADSGWASAARYLPNQARR
jgi:hypothetical protein